MVFWFAACSAAIVWLVFQSPAFDYRLVMAGSLLGLVELPFGPGPFQSLSLSVLVLGAVMVGTIGRRLSRRKWLGVPIGMFLHLVLNGAWSSHRVFWWPLFGIELPGQRAMVIDRGVWSVVLEAAGVLVGIWLWGEFGFSDRGRRQRFLRTGQLDRSFVGARRQIANQDTEAQP